MEGVDRVKEQRQNKGELLLKGPGRSKLMACARSFEGLSRSFYYLPDRKPEECRAKDFSFDRMATRSDIIWHNRLSENRLMVADQLLEVSKIIEDMADEIGRIGEVSAKKEERIRKVLKREGLTAEDILAVQNKDGRLEIYMNVKADWGNRIASKEAAEYLSSALKVRMTPSLHAKSMIDAEFVSICFEEEPSFHVLTGYAKSIKDRETESGDSFSFARTERGHMLMSLSDGMGSGPAAAYESRTSIELLEQFVEAGFSTDAAASMINGAMIGRSEERIITTLDVCRFDLYDGFLSYLKAGASSTFIRHKDGVEIITSENLPLGIFHELDFDKGTKKLYDEDIVVMVTDGVLDRLGGNAPEKRFARVLMQTECRNPKEIAGRLLKYVMLSSDGPCRDDMTVLVTGIWRN